MKLTSILFAFFCLTTMNINAQEFTGIDEYFGESGYFDNIEEALANPMEVLYLDLGMQVPKLKAIPVEVYRFPNLKILDVSFNQIASIDIGISKLTALESFNLNGNQYLNAVKGDISMLGSLTEINLTQTGLSDDQVATIKAALPENCNVIK